MPARLALVLCAFFIMALLRIERRANPKRSFALWLPSIWALIIASRMVTQWFGGGSTSREVYVDGSPLDAALFLALTVCAFAVIAKRRLRVSEMGRSNVWLCVFLVYCGISVMWSDFPFVSFKRYIKELSNVLMVLVVLGDVDPIGAIRTVANRCAYILIPFSIALYKYVPDLGRRYDDFSGALIVTGVTGNKNTLGILCAVCGLALCWNLLSIKRSKRLSTNKAVVTSHLVILAMAIWLLGSASSATSTVCFVLGLLVLVGTGAKVVGRRVKVYLAVAVLLSVGYMTYFAPVVMGTLGRDETLTGRREVWAVLLGMHTDPMFGGGYGSFWLGDRLDKLWREYAWRPTEAHNGYLEIYLDLGIVGVALLLCVIVSSFRSALRRIASDFEYGSFRLAMLVISILFNVTESGFRPGQLMYFFFLLAAVQLSYSARVAIPKRGSMAVPRGRQEEAR